jgi:hypothetical protein
MSRYVLFAALTNAQTAPLTLQDLSQCYVDALRAQEKVPGPPAVGRNCNKNNNLGALFNKSEYACVWLSVS